MLKDDLLRVRGDMIQLYKVLKNIEDILIRGLEIQENFFL